MDEIIKNLNELLSDLNVFYRKLQNYHWNIKGKNFFTIHSKLEEYYNEVNEQIDEIAEHILSLGYQPLGTMKDYLQISKISEAENEKICEDDVFTNVMQDMQIILDRLLTIKKLSDQNNEYMTSSLCDEYMLEYSKKIWMFKQMKQ